MLSRSAAVACSCWLSLLNTVLCFSSPNSLSQGRTVPEHGRTHLSCLQLEPSAQRTVSFFPFPASRVFQMAKGSIKKKISKTSACSVDGENPAPLKFNLRNTSWESPVAPGLTLGSIGWAKHPVVQDFGTLTFFRRARHFSILNNGV